jgi:ProQ/FINO family
VNEKLNPSAGDTGVPKVSADELNLPNKSPKSPVKKKRSSDTVEAVILLLAERWPLAFSVREGRRKPLKIGIFADIMPPSTAR